jgi:hypothetical protein
MEEGRWYNFVQTVHNIDKAVGFADLADCIFTIRIRLFLTI